MNPNLPIVACELGQGNKYGEIDDMIFWFAQQYSVKVGMLSRSGSVRHFDFPNGNSVFIEAPSKNEPFTTNVHVHLKNGKDSRRFQTDRMHLLEMLDSLYDQFGK